jgi:short-subunit dehydrogenase
MDTVLIIGATGNIGVAAVLGALRSNHNVLAIVRNQASANKLFQHVGTKNGITTVEADIMSDRGVQIVVNQVRAGKLPPFRHVYSAGKSPIYSMRTLLNVSTSWQSIRCNSIARSQHQ